MIDIEKTSWKLRPEEKQAIKSLKGQKSSREIANIYRISHTTVLNIWKETEINGNEIISNPLIAGIFDKMLELFVKLNPSEDLQTFTKEEDEYLTQLLDKKYGSD